MALLDPGKKVMLEALGAVALRAHLYDGEQAELEGEGYTEQIIAWTYDDGEDILNLNADGEGICAEFSVPAGTVKYIGCGSADTLTDYILHDLEADAETFANPGTYQITAGSVELDPTL